MELYFLVAKWFRRRVDKGSPTIITVGAIAGILLGAYIAFELRGRDLLGREWVPYAIAISIVGGFCGVLLGTLVGPSAPITPVQLPRHVNPLETVRVTNLFKASTPFLLLTLSTALLIGLTIYTHFLWQKGELWKADNWKWAVFVEPGVATICIVFCVICGRAVFWIDLGRDVVVRRLFSASRHPRAHIETWGFYASPGVWTREAAADEAQFVIIFVDGLRFEAAVLSRKSAEIARMLKS